MLVFVCFWSTPTSSRGLSLPLTAAVEIMNTQHGDHAPPHTRTDCGGLAAEPQWGKKVTAISGDAPLFNMSVSVEKKNKHKRAQEEKKNANRKWRDGKMNRGRGEKKEGPEENKSNSNTV